MEKYEEVPQYKKDGESYVSLELDGKNVERRVCDLVWESFKGKIPEGYKVTHIDGNSENNRLDNLKLEKCQ